MLIRPALLLATIALVSTTTACSSLTHPDEIQIVAETRPGTMGETAKLPAQPAARPAPGPGRATAPAAPPPTLAPPSAAARQAGGGNCGG